MGEKIKVIYGEEKETDEYALQFPLPLWFNEVIEKYEEDLTLLDVCRCIRQNLFVDSAFKKLIVFLKEDPYMGELWDGELIDKAAQVDKKYLIQYKDELLEIIKSGYEFIEKTEWEYEDDRTEYIGFLEKLKEAIEAASKSSE